MNMDVITPQLPPSPVCQYTDAGYPTEPDACKELDDRLERSGLFRVFTEVWGQYLQPRYTVEQKDPRIDRLLVPTLKLLSAGWRHGAIGVECKRSGEKLGTVIAQCQDYGRAVFTGDAGIGIVCGWIFIWPLSDFKGDIASVMTQNKIGGLCGTEREPLIFKSACGALLRIGADRSIKVGNVQAGMKVGSR